MKTAKAICALLFAIAALTVTSAAYSKGCLKGAALGGVAGHVAGHHGVAGAALGCAVGHHEAAKKDKAAAVAAQNNANGQPPH
ncbi:hypothetical protein AAGS40_26125 (plasmid) [Paraburkholderia sp. PREW-6R]|uniref:hypothetical protein n=1 Tax=Paraburkholderia sp. PREW-6R TaxID=3141544 RepID=UPI0031F59C27